MEEKRAEFEKLLNEEPVKAWMKLNSNVSELNQRLEKSLQEQKLGLSRFQIFSLLFFSGPLQASQIARKLNVTRGNISMFIKRLLADNLIQISSQTESLKRPAYELNSSGYELFCQVFPLYIDTIKDFMREKF